MTTSTGTTAALDIYRDAHPHHVARLQERTSAHLPGTVATLTITGPTDTATFYTGIKDGDRVVITDRHDYNGHTSLSVRATSQPGTHLSVNDGHTLTPVDPADWTETDARAAQEAADTYAEGAKESALTHATGYGRYGNVQPDGEERAIAALRAAAEAKHYAFAISHYVRVLAAVERANRDPKYAAVLASRGMHAVA